MAFTLQEGRAQ
jgi:bifunctional non-homologous end joining protein LigD